MPPIDIAFLKLSWERKTFRKFLEFYKPEWNIESNRLWQGKMNGEITMIESEPDGRKAEIKFMFRMCFKQPCLKCSIQYYKILSYK